MLTGARRAIGTALLLAILLSIGTPLKTVDAAGEKSTQKGATPKIQLAILLDTSGSMRGLIDQARTQIWKIVNEFTTVSRDGKSPILEVALFQYGHANLGVASGFMQQVVPLTDDLDKVSEELFKLTIGGSKEYCGQAIDLAAQQLKWSQSDRDLKCIFIAGNEPFTQGPIDFKTACHTAASSGITVSTIYCGPKSEGISGQWEAAAKLADGSFMNIDQNKRVAAIPAPQDRQLAELSQKLNTTYIAFGTAEKRGAAIKRQTAQDANAASAGLANAAVRAAVKCSTFYCPTWDLCDAYKNRTVKLEDVDVGKLPEVMQKMNLDERTKYIEAKLKERQAIQDQMKKLSEAREKFVAVELEKRAKANPSASASFDAAVVNSIRKQAVQKQFKFEKK